MPERREGQVDPVSGGLLGRHTYPSAILTMLGLAVAYAMLGRLSVLLAIKKATALGIQAYLTKPLVTRELRLAIRQILDQPYTEGEHPHGPYSAHR